MTMYRDPYVEGKQAYNEGKPKSANPYPDTSSDRVVWGAGWRDGQKRDEEDRQDRKAA